jgi:hypothetical protein
MFPGSESTFFTYSLGPESGFFPYFPQSEILTRFLGIVYDTGYSAARLTPQFSGQVLLETQQTLYPSHIIPEGWIRICHRSYILRNRHFRG